jgi:hypothetical protein
MERGLGAETSSLFRRGRRGGQPDARGQAAAHLAALAQPADPGSGISGQGELLSRSVRGVELTAAGKTFLDHARLALAQIDAAAEAARKALAAGDAWLEKGANLLCFGPPGGGKSHLAAASKLFVQDNGPLSAIKRIVSGPSLGIVGGERLIDVDEGTHPSLIRL